MTNQTYGIQDWIVHRSYGVGQVVKIEVKPIHGSPTECYRVKTKDGVYWLPLDSLDTPRIRPVATPDRLEQAVQELHKTDLTLDPDRHYWKKRIENVKEFGDLVAISCLVRDLSLLRTQRRLNQTEESALNTLTERLLREWSACAHKDIDRLRHKFNTTLQETKTRFSESLA
jgi:RNA polymerase-interacting CarD/CdnL/TRCF family regulator